MKTIYLILLLGLLHLQAQSQTLVTTQRINKGVVYKKYTASGSIPGPNNIFVLQIDLSDPAIKLQAAKSNDIVGGAQQTVKTIAANKDDNGNYHNVLGAVNGDLFFSNGNPVNLLVPDGQVFMNRNLSPARSIFGISDNNDPFIALPTENYKVTKGGVVKTINGVNTGRGVDQLVLYNQYKGSSTGTNNLGTEVKIGLVSGQVWTANAPVQCVVLAKQAGVGNMAFSARQAVLSGHGTAATYLNGYNVNDVVTVQLDMAAGVSNITQVLGGFPRLLSNGSNVASTSILSEGGTSDQNTTLNPRTGLGISQDEKTLYMVVVDGRTTASVGMSMTQFASLFSALGAYNAINLDGGGSSTLVSNNVVMNVPADGAERAVATALLVWTSSRLFEDFNANEGKFTKTPSEGGSVGIASTSTMDRVTTSPYSGAGCERAVLVDNTSSTSNWIVRLMSGDGVPANNVRIPSKGTFSVWLKTATASSNNAKIYLRFDESATITEETPGIDVIRDGQWHQYNFNLDYTTGGTSIVGGNGVLADSVTFESIILKQNNTSSTWTVYFDEITHNLQGGATGVSSLATTSAPAQPLLTTQADSGLDKHPLQTTSKTTLYPNPNNGNFTISFGDAKAVGSAVEIRNLQGQKIYEGKIQEVTQTFNIGSVAEGLYIISVKGTEYQETLKTWIGK